MRTAVTESSILSFHSMPNTQKKSVADLIYSVIEKSRGQEGLSMAEIQNSLRAIKINIEKSTISARINEMVAAGRLYRYPHLRKCSITGKSIHPVSLAFGQMGLL